MNIMKMLTRILNPSIRIDSSIRPDTVSSKTSLSSVTDRFPDDRHTTILPERDSRWDGGF